MLDDITFLHGRHRPECIATVDKTFDYHTVQLMTRGAVELRYDDDRHELHGTWTWPCHPGPRIRFREWPSGQPWEHRYIAFTGPRVATWEADGLWPREPQAVAPEHADALAGLFDELIGLALDTGPWSRRRAVNLLERVLLELAEARRTTPHRPAWLVAVIDALSSGEATPDYDALARSVSMSTTTLRRRFRAATGYTMHQFLLERRIATARFLLGDTDIPIKHIAAQLGYGDVFYFTRQFTRITGVPPAAYRRTRQ